MKFNRFIEANYPADAEKLKIQYNDMIINYSLIINNYELNDCKHLLLMLNGKEALDSFRYINSYRKMHDAEQKIPLYLKGLVDLLNDLQNT